MFTAPALQGNRSQGLTLERGNLSSPAPDLGLGLGLGLGMASFILNADLELVAVRALDTAEVTHPHSVWARRRAFV